MADVEAVAEVGVSISKASLDALSATIAKAVDKGLAGFAKKLKDSLSKAGLDKINRDLAASAKKVADAYDRIGTVGTKSLRGLGSGLGATNKETLKLVQSMEKLAQGQEVIAAAIKSNALITAKQLIDTTKQTDRANQERIRGATEVAKREVVITQGAEQQKVVAARFAGQQRVQLTRAVIENIARLERGLAATIAGIARTAVGATGKVFGSLTSMFSRGGAGAGGISSSTSAFSSSIKRMNSELNRDVSSSLSRREQTLRSSFIRQERILSQSAQRQAATLTKLRQQTSTGVLGAATGRGIGPGLGTLGAGVGIGALLTSGFTRFSELERLNKQFLALTGNAEKAAMLMAQVKEFAKLTPFDLVGVAGLAKGFLAIGTAAELVMPQVKAIADAVALTGGGVEQLDRIQRAIGQVVSTGKLQGDELNQLAESLPGLNIRKILAKQLTGGDVAKLVEMQAAGEITGEAFVSGLIAGLQEDPRLIGASEDLAKTLGGIAANTKESFEDLGASIIGLFAPQLKIGFKTAQLAMQSLSQFIKGEGLSTGLDQLRTALGGVAAGLAAVALAKGGVEVLGLLAKVVGLIASPLGLIATAAGLLGAGLALALKNSVPFRLALEGLGERFGDVAGRIRDFVGDKLTALSDFITRTVVPALIHLADWIGANLLDAADATISFIDNSVLPTIARWAQIVVRDLLGAYRATVDFIKREVIPRVTDFVNLLRDEVFPVVADVARAIAGGFMDALGAVQRFGQRIRPFIQPAIDGFKDLWHGIQNALGGDFSGLGSGAMGALGGIGRSVVNLWDLAFEALRPLAQKALDLIQSVFTIDNLIKAGKAVLNFVEWIGNTLGSIVTHPAFIAAVAGIVGAAALVGLRFLEGFVRGMISNVPTLFGYIKEAFLDNLDVVFGVLIGGAALAMVVRGFRSMGGAAGAGFLSGLRATFAGGVGLTQGLLSGRLPGGGSSLMASAQIKDLKAVEKQAAQLQSRLLTFGVQKVYDPTKSGIRMMQVDLRAANLLLSESQRMGLLTREAIGNIGKTLASVFRGPGAFAGAFKSLWASLGQQAAEGGPRVGTQIAKGIGMGLATGFASFTTGKFMGEAGQSPLMGILTGAFTGFAISGGNPIAAGIGAIAAGIGHAIGESAREAKEARERIKGFAEAISHDLQSAVDRVGPSLAEFNDLLAGAGSGEFLATLRAQLADVTPGLNDLGISTEMVMGTFKQGEAAVQALLDKLRARAGPRPEGAGLGSRAELTAWEDRMAALAPVISAIGAAWEAAAGGLALYNQEQRDLLLGQMKPGATPTTGMMGRGIFDGPQGTGMFGDPNAFKTTLAGMWTDAKDFYANLGREERRHAADQAQSRAIRNLADDGREFNKELMQINAQWDTFGDKPKPKTVEQLAEDAEKLAADLIAANTAIDNILRDRPTTSLTTVLRDLMLGLVGGGSALNLDGFLDDLELSAFKDDLVAKLTPIFAQAISEGWAITPENFDPLAEQMIESLMHGLDDPDGKIKEQLVILMDELRAEIASHPLTFDPTLSVDEGGVISHGSWFKLPEIEVGPDDIDLDTKGINSKLDAGGSSGGRFLMSGMVRGINIGKAGAINTAVAAANEMVRRVKAALGVQSPSKVFEEIGRNIGEGLEIGVEDSLATVGDKVASFVQNAIDKALDAVKGGTATLRAAGSSLFAALIGSDAPLGGGPMIGQIGGWTLALQSWIDSAWSSAAKAMEVAAKSNAGEEPLTPGELNILGESGFSLNLADVLGAENVAGLRGVLDTIVGFGVEMLEAGVPVDQVVDKIKQWRDELLVTSGVLGFNVDDVKALIDSLGLSDAALTNFVLGLDSVTAAADAASAAAKEAAEKTAAKAASRTRRGLLMDAIGLSPEDLDVFVRENELDHNFLVDLAALQKDISDNTREENEDLGRTLGLWGSTLSSFVDGLEDWLEGLGEVVSQIPEVPWSPTAQQPVDPNAPVDAGGRRLPLSEINVNVYPPYGDPMAIGLGVVNAVAIAAALPGQ